MKGIVHTLADSGGQEAPARDSNLLAGSAGEQGALRPGQQKANRSACSEGRRRATEALSDWDIMVAGRGADRSVSRVLRATDRATSKSTRKLLGLARLTQHLSSAS